MLVDGAPHPVRRPGDIDDDLIEVPLVAGPRHPPPDLVRGPQAKLQRPLPHRFVTDDMPPERPQPPLPVVTPTFGIARLRSDHHAAF